MDIKICKNIQIYYFNGNLGNSKGWKTFDKFHRAQLVSISNLFKGILFNQNLRCILKTLLHIYIHKECIIPTFQLLDTQ